MTPTKFQPTQNNSDKVEALAQIVAYRAEELFDALEVKLFKNGNKYVGACPVHGGDNNTALNLWPEGYKVFGYWKCRSHKCQDIFKKTIIGFTRGVLSHKECNWHSAGEKVISFQDTLAWLCGFIKQDLNEIKVDTKEIERRRFAAEVESIRHAPTIKANGVPRSVVRSKLQIPAEFYLKRGYSEGILDRYDIGLCSEQGKEMCDRVVVPIYDSRKLMVGCSGRSIHKACANCGSYHSQKGNCPSPADQWLYSKWKHSKNFNAGSYLYNYWCAEKFIRESNTVVLVEGPGDVWRLEEAGVHNAVAMFGLELADEQQVTLEMSGAMKVVLLLDNDKAGQEAIPQLKKILSRSYNLSFPKLLAKDVGEMSVEQVRSIGELYG
jgi:5S rRNA maturation endonuclease (ribonuclease M5)